MTSLDWFPLWLSLRVASLSTLVAFLLGLYLAWLLVHRDFRGKPLLEFLLSIPLALPSTVLAYYLLVVAGAGGPLEGLWTSLTGAPFLFTWKAAVLAALVHSLPLFVHSARLALGGVDPAYERAARSLGATEWTLFWRVSLPLAWGPILAAVTLAFARSLGDFGMTLLLAGNIPGRTQTLSVAVYDAVRGGNGTAARFFVVLSSALAIALLALGRRFQRGSSGGIP